MTLPYILPVYHHHCVHARRHKMRPKRNPTIDTSPALIIPFVQPLKYILYLLPVRYRIPAHPTYQLANYIALFSLGVRARTTPHRYQHVT